MKHHSRSGIAISFGSCLLIPCILQVHGSSGTELVTNGSFQQGFTGWTATGDVDQNGSDTKDVNAARFNAADTPVNAQLVQTLATQAGQRYRLKFQYGAQAGGPNQAQQLRVVAQGNQVDLSELVSSTTYSASIAYAPRSFSFVADSAATKLIFNDVSANSVGVDSYLTGVSVQAQSATDPVFPGNSWEQATPESQGVDSQKLSAAVQYLQQNTGSAGVSALVVVRNGRVIWQGSASTQVYEVWSCTKSFVSTCLGLLIDDNRCSLDTLATQVAPELAASYPAIKLRHFATMTSGYSAVGDVIGDGSHGQSSTPFNPSSQPVFTPPGSQFAYWDSAMNIFGLVLTRIAGEPLQVLLQHRIGDTLDLTQWTWGNLGFDNGILVNGTAGMISISALDMARFGYLFLNQGNWNGFQLVSADWVNQVATVQIPVSMPWADPKSGIDGRGVYGLNWWCNGVTVTGGRLWSGGTAGTYGASGIQNNKLFVIPEWQMVIVRLGLGETDKVLTDDVLGQFLGGVGQAITGTTSVPPPTHTLTIASSNPGTGAVIAVTPKDLNGATNGLTAFTRSYPAGATVTLTAAATAGGNTFAKWQEDGVDATTSTNFTVNMGADHTVTAFYATPVGPPTFTLAVGSLNPASNASIMVSPKDLNGASNGLTAFTRSYSSGATVTLIAAASAGGNTFAKWQEDGIDATTSTNLAVSMNANHSVTAVYAPPVSPQAFTLAVGSLNPASNASIVVSPKDLNGATNGLTAFTRSYTNGTTVTLTAAASAGGNIFAKWQEDGFDATTSTNLTVSMNANHSVTAVYAPPVSPPSFTLAVGSLNPANNASIVVSPKDLNGATNGLTAFTRSYPSGTTVTLVAAASAGGNIFAKWQEDGVDATTSTNLTVSMDANHTVTAVYAPPHSSQAFALTVSSLNPASNVSIVVSPKDLNNAGNGLTAFTRSYPSGTTVTLVAAASAGGNTFAKWQKDDVDATTSTNLTVSMDASHTATAVYAPPVGSPIFTLSVSSLNPTNNVPIAVAPTDLNGVTNGLTAFTCSYPSGATVTLIAPASAGGNIFAKWQEDGVDATTSTNLTVSIDANHSVTAVYALPVGPPTYILSVDSSNPATNVFVAVSPADLTGDTNELTGFTRLYANGTIVTLVAAATAGENTFLEWQEDGAYSTITPYLTVSMDADHSLVAVYGPVGSPTFTLSINSIGAATNVLVTVSPTDLTGAANGTTGFARYYSSGATVILVAAPTAGVSTFQKWQIDGVDSTTSTNLTLSMDTNHTVTAVYSIPAETTNQLEIHRDSANLVITWSAGLLQTATSITGPWLTVTHTDGSFIVAPDSRAVSFYRVVSN